MAVSGLVGVGIGQNDERAEQRSAEPRRQDDGMLARHVDHGLAGHGVAQGLHVGGTHLRREGARKRRPGIEGVVHEQVRGGGDHPLELTQGRQGT